MYWMFVPFQTFSLGVRIPSVMVFGSKGLCGDVCTSDVSVTVIKCHNQGDLLTTAFY